MFMLLNYGFILLFHWLSEYSIFLLHGKTKISLATPPPRDHIAFLIPERIDFVNSVNWKIKINSSFRCSFFFFLVRVNRVINLSNESGRGIACGNNFFFFFLGRVYIRYSCSSGRVRYPLLFLLNNSRRSNCYIHSYNVPTTRRHVCKVCSTDVMNHAIQII